jgi:DNA-binding winged helix-turn-helix (wHTH) protein
MPPLAQPGGSGNSELGPAEASTPPPSFPLHIRWAMPERPGVSVGESPTHPGRFARIAALGIRSKSDGAASSASMLFLKQYGRCGDLALKEQLLRGFWLADVRVDPLRAAFVAPDGRERHVQPKAMEVLLCLAEAHHELVERDDIVDRVWGDKSVSDSLLTRCVGDLRHALDDYHEDPRFIQTLHKRGYRLVAPISLSSAIPADTEPEVFAGLEQVVSKMKVGRQY